MRKAKALTRGTTAQQQAIKEASDLRVAGTQRGVDKEAGERSRKSVSEATSPKETYATKVARLHDTGASVGDAKAHKQRSRPAKEQQYQAGVRDIGTQGGGQAREVMFTKRTAATAQLPPDRLAAARERLRVKSEERRRALRAAVG